MNKDSRSKPLIAGAWPADRPTNAFAPVISMFIQSPRWTGQPYTTAAAELSSDAPLSDTA
jgi:hypothetical protein